MLEASVLRTQRSNKKKVAQEKEWQLVVVGFQATVPETCPARMPLKLNSLVRNSEQGLAWRSRGLARHHTVFGQPVRVTRHKGRGKRPGFHSSLATNEEGVASNPSRASEAPQTERVR